VLVVETTLKIGNAAEDVASELLRRNGYFVVERNFRCKAGELDAVAFRGDPALRHSRDPAERRAARMLVFIEVRSRDDAEHGDALLSIGASKQKQVVRVAGLYLSFREPEYDEIRFDVVGITGGVPTLVEDAFRPQ
jgi:putative endonuclease